MHPRANPFPPQPASQLNHVPPGPQESGTAELEMLRSELSSAVRKAVAAVEARWALGCLIVWEVGYVRKGCPTQHPQLGRHAPLAKAVWHVLSSQTRREAAEARAAAAESARIDAENARNEADTLRREAQVRTCMASVAWDMIDLYHKGRSTTCQGTPGASLHTFYLA